MSDSDCRKRRFVIFKEAASEREVINRTCITKKRELERIVIMFLLIINWERDDRVTLITKKLFVILEREAVSGEKGSYYIGCIIKEREL